MGRSLAPACDRRTRIRGAGPNSGLDAAANRAAEQQTPKAYWHTDASIYGEEVIGSAGNRYRIRTGVQVTQWTPSHPASAWVNSWTGRGPASVRVLIGRDLPTRLASSEDEAAWRREGAPKLCGNDTDCENDINRFGRHGGYATSHLLPLTDTLLPTQGPSLTSTPGISLTSDELLDLPQDPDALKKRLMPFWLTYEKQTARRPPATSITGRSPYTKNSWFWAISVELLRDAPITGAPAPPSTGWLRNCPVFAPWAGFTTSRDVPASESHGCDSPSVKGRMSNSSS